VEGVDGVKLKFLDSKTPRREISNNNVIPSTFLNFNSLPENGNGQKRRHII